MKLAVVGTGYVGLVSGVCLAAKGHDVTCVDINPAIVDRLNRAEPTIYEEGLPELLKEVRDSGRFRATTQITEALDGSDLVLIAVGTPSENGVIDLKYIRQVAGEIGAYIKTAGRHISVVVKSTVVPGTTDTVVREEIEAASGFKHPAFGLGMNPEFLREGEAIEDFAEPDRIVLGNEDPETLARLEELYAPWSVDKVRVNTRTAEMIKYANNALLATQISAVNEIANLAAALGGIDVLDVVGGVHLDKRWNPILEAGARAKPQILTYLVPGCGFGGSCFPKDVQALRSQGEQNGLPMRMMNAVLDVNDAQPSQVLDIVERDLPDLSGKRVLVLGLAFKPGTDDVRESASLKIVDQLVAKGADVVAHDPIAVDHFKKAVGPAGEQVRYVEDWEAEVASAQVVIVATKWPDYAVLTSQDLSGKLLFDARRMFPPAQVGGAQYLSIGRRIA
ncbi:UDP-glucose/GDP-mannose dehydrogenase family protein [Brevundimonas diminuta]|uniref:UDP-glucose dehydrogenase family protein n=1 Tax=Brevundimonas TaxID=41275 RepID=UPI00168BCCAA|nr:UDP-glucose/GDP-mannose dehydrogenase family protein [Brevundimonas diminuta]MBD3574348.1 UDP-glucose/GDP-mannose dehydrogenase family protein [Brevundimonas diminuta]